MTSSESGGPIRNPIFQQAYVVNDLRAAMEKWHAVTGIGPFFVFDPLVVIDPLYRGRPTPIDISIALVQAGDDMIELIEQRSDGPSAYRDMYPAGEEGFHHFACLSGQFDRDLAWHAARGHETAGQGTLDTGMRFAYVDTVGELGVMLELIEDSDYVREFQQNMKDVSAAWDGSDPYRSV